MPTSKRDWEKLVQRISKNTDQVFFTSHAISQMKARKITKAMALDVLRKGVIHIVPEVDIKTGDTKCRMQRFTAGKQLAVVAACKDESAINCIVVTAFVVGD
jgi:Domain of unknown function (DUF4258)